MEEAATLPALPPWRMMGYVVALIAGAALLVYAQSLWNGFVRWDDGLLITENPAVRLLSAASLKRMFTTYDPELYIPLTLLSYAFDFMIGGGQPFLFHLHSLVLHIINALLVTWLLYVLLRNGQIAVIAGLLFALHPLNVEAVAWASARKDLLSTMYFLGSVLTYLYYRDHGGKLLYCLSIALFAAGLLSKVMILTLPVLLLLLDDLRHRTRDARMFADKLPYVGLSLIFGVIALFGKTNIVAQTTLLQKILMAGKSTLFYLQKLVVPWPLSVLYPYDGALSMTNPGLVIPCVIVAALLIVSLLLHRRARVVTFAALFFLIALAPTFINFAKGQGDVYLASDRYAYLPMIGLLVLDGWILTRVVQRWPSATRGVYAVLAVILLAYGVLSYRQSLTWKSTESLFTHVLSVYPSSYIAHANMGNAFRREGRDEEAIRELKASIAIRPHDRTHSNLGAVYRKLGRLEEAHAEYDAALALDADSKEAHMGLGLVYQQEGRTDEALASFRRAVEIDPFYEEAQTNLGSLLLKYGRIEEAVAAYRTAIAVHPGFFEAQYNLGILYLKQGKPTEAIEAFRDAVAADSSSVDARLNLGVLLFNAGERDEAVRQFKAVLLLDPGNANALKALRQIGE